MNRSNLVTTLELIQPALSDTDPVPMFQCFTFTGKHALAYNDRLCMITPCETQEAFAINGKILLGLLKNSHSDDVDFTKTDKNDITIKAGKSRFKLPYFPEEDFLFKEPDGKAVFDLTLDATAFDACMITASRDLAQEALLGVTLKPGPDKTMAFYSCDGDAVTRYTLEAKAKDVSVRLPNEFCESFIRTFKELETEYASIKIIGDEWVRAEFNKNVVIYGRLLKLENPLDHEALIAKTLKGKPVFKPVPKALDDALSRARVVADPESAKTALEVTDGKLLLHTETHMGIINDSMVWREHAEVQADVSAALVQRAIGLCDEMGVLERCTIYQKQPNLFIIVCNMG
jgi:DNA polymerase III sliding clamp (beta) subunit (PCNA family)